MSKTGAERLFDNIEDMPLPSEVYLSIASICKRLDIHKATFYRLAAEHKIERHRIAGTTSVRYRLSDVLRLLRKEGDKNEHTQDRIGNLQSSVEKSARKAMFQKLSEKVRSRSI